MMTHTFIIVSLSRNLRYRQLRKLKVQFSEVGHVMFSWNISSFTMASFNPVGSRPIARQKRITCITGRAKMNSITLDKNNYCVQYIGISRRATSETLSLGELIKFRLFR